MAVFQVKKYKIIKDENGNKIQIQKSKEEWNKETCGGTKTFYFSDRYKLNGQTKQYKSANFALKRDAKDDELIFLANPVKYIQEHSKRARKQINEVIDDNNKDKTLNDYFKEFTKYQLNYVKESTVYEYSDCWKLHFSELIGNYYPSDLNLPLVKEIKKKLGNKTNYRTNKTYCIDTLNKWLYCLSAFFEYLFSDGLIELNYIKIIGGFKNPNSNINEEKKIKFQKEEEFNAFMEVVDDEFWYTFFNFLFWHGLRIGEQRALKIKNINLEKKHIIIEANIAKDRNGKEIVTSIKNRKKRKIFLANQSYDHIKKLIEFYQNINGYSEEWYLFGGEIRLAKNMIQRKLEHYYSVLIKKYPNQIINKLTHHEFGRHSHASYLLNVGIAQGMGIDEICSLIAQRLGDTAEVIRLTYAHQYEDENDKKLINLLK